MATTVNKDSYTARYEIWSYPFKTFHPVVDLKNPENGEKNLPPSDVYGDPVQITNATGVSFSRTKQSVNDTASFTIYGPVSASCFKGNWIIIKGFGGNHALSLNGAAQFVGQIERLNISYSTDQRGKISQNTTVIIRSWAYVLRSFVKLDAFSLAQLEPPGTQENVSTLQKLTPKSSIKSLIDFCARAFNPFQFATAVLQLVGAAQQKFVNDHGSEYIDAKTLKLPDVALAMPAIPNTLCDLVATKDIDCKNALSTGFLDVIAGVNISPDQNPNNGEYNEAIIFNNVDELLDFEGMYEPNVSRPKLTDVASILLAGNSAWQAIDDHMDHISNEMFADFYVIGEADAKQSLFQPFITIRDKPFATKDQRSDKSPTKSQWSNFDDITKIIIPANSVIGINLTDSFLNSPNYIRFQYNSVFMIPASVISNAAIKSTLRNADTMSRFGGSSMITNLDYIFYGLDDKDHQPANAGNNNSKALKKISNYNLEENFSIDLSKMTDCWYGQDYMYPSGSLVLIDNNFIFNVGVNIQFDIGKNTFIAHIDGFSKTYSIDSKGKHSTRTIINFSKLCWIDPGFKIITFVPPSLILDLYASDSSETQNTENTLHRGENT